MDPFIKRRNNVNDPVDTLNPIQKDSPKENVHAARDDNPSNCVVHEDDVDWGGK